MNTCERRDEILTHFEQPRSELSLGLVEHLGTCPICLAAIGSRLDTQARSDSLSAVRTRGDASAAGLEKDVLTPKGHRLLTRGQEMLRRQLNIVSS